MSLKRPLDNYIDRVYALLVHKLKISREFEHIPYGIRGQCDYTTLLDAINTIALLLHENRDLTVSFFFVFFEN